MKVCPPLVPPAVVTVTVRAAAAAVGSSTKLAVSDVVLLTTTLLTVTPAPADGHRRGADDEIGAGQRDRHRGALDALSRRDAGQRRRARRRRQVIVKVCPPLVPPAVVTVTVRAPAAAAGSITKLAVSDVVLPTTTLLTVTPAPLTATVVAPDDEIGARQRDRHRRALDCPDSARRWSASARSAPAA